VAVSSILSAPRANANPDTPAPVNRIATVTALRPARRTVSTSTAPAAQLHDRLIDAANRPLEASESTESTELTAEDALGFFLGGLINTVPPGSKAPSKHDLVELLERTADRLGCPEVAPVRGLR